MAATISFPDFVSSLADLGRLTRDDPAVRASAAEVVTALRAMGTPTRESLAELIRRYPNSVPALATCVGLTHEQLKNQLSFLLGTSGWVLLARQQPERLIAMLDDEFGLVEQLGAQLGRDWSFADVLAERYLWSRRGAVGAAAQGRSVENDVEAVVRDMGLAYQVRTRFVGRENRTAPCDLAIPEGGEAAQIVVGMKGFNSTGSKLTDAVREIVDMASVRRPRQFVLAVVDGIGWRNRQADLRRIHQQWEENNLDGLYTLAHLDRFRADLQAAAERLGLSRVPGGGS